jgi:hypothetical protein
MAHPEGSRQNKAPEKENSHEKLTAKRSNGKRLFEALKKSLSR